MPAVGAVHERQSLLGEGVRRDIGESSWLIHRPVSPCAMLTQRTHCATLAHNAPPTPTTQTLGVSFMRLFVVAAAIGAGLTLANSGTLQAQTGTPVFDSIPMPVPPNVPSQPFQAQQTLEFGDQVKLEASTPRRAGFVSVLMSTWALREEYPALSSGGWTHPITLNIYNDAVSAAAHSPVKTVTQTFTIPWRPVNDESCPDDSSWKAADGQCYHGLAFNIVFDLRALNFDLPSTLIYGIAYDTNSWGYHPIGLPGPYESLNVGLNDTSSPSVGTDVNPDAVYWNTLTAAWYADGGYSGVGLFRQDTNWTGYVPAVEFTTFAMPSSADDCKNGAWQNLVRSDFTSFTNQGACVSYTKVGDRDGHGDSRNQDARRNGKKNDKKGNRDR